MKPSVPGSKVPRAATTSMSEQAAAEAGGAVRVTTEAPPISESAARHERIRMDRPPCGGRMTRLRERRTRKYSPGRAGSDERNQEKRRLFLRLLSSRTTPAVPAAIRRAGRA